MWAILFASETTTTKTLSASKTARTPADQNKPLQMSAANWNGRPMSRQAADVARLGIPPASIVFRMRQLHG